MAKAPLMLPRARMAANVSAPRGIPVKASITAPAAHAASSEACERLRPRGSTRKAAATKPGSSAAVVMKAAQLLDAGSEQAELMISVAKSKVAKAAGLAVREGVQMHGGIGMTDEYDVGFFLKRARVLEAAWGSSSHLRDRYAAMKGY